VHGGYLRRSTSPAGKMIICSPEGALMPNGHPLLPICSTASDLRRHFSTIDSSRAGFMRQRLETLLRFLYMKQPL
jgi:hypothetical protein